MGPKWCCVVEIGRSVDPKIRSGREPYDQVVKVGEGWVDLEPVLLTNCWVVK